MGWIIGLLVAAFIIVPLAKKYFVGMYRLGQLDVQSKQAMIELNRRNAQGK